MGSKPSQTCRNLIPQSELLSMESVDCCFGFLGHDQIIDPNYPGVK
jgi:hypothetical protein